MKHRPPALSFRFGHGSAAQRSRTGDLSGPDGPSEETPLSLRDVADLLFERGIDICQETAGNAFSPGVEVRNGSRLCENAADAICRAMIYPQKAHDSTIPQDTIASPPPSGGMLREFLVAERLFTASVESRH